MSVPPFYRTKLVHEIFPIGDDINVWASDPMDYLSRTPFEGAAVLM